MSKYTPSAAGKGSQPRNKATDLIDCPLWKQVKLNSGVSLTPEMASEAINKACEIISLLETEEGDNWVNKYYV